MKVAERIITKKYDLDIAEKCDFKTKQGKCMIPLSKAILCLDCYTVHVQERCPNCYSSNLVRIIELFFAIENFDESVVKSKIKEFLER